MKKKTKGSNGVKVAALGAGLAGLAATAYFFLGPKGKKHQHNTKAWAINMKKDIVAKLKKAKKITEPAYRGIIDSVAKEYAKETRAGREEVNALAKDLKKHWTTISKSVKAVKQEVKKVASKVAKKS